MGSLSCLLVGWHELSSMFECLALFGGDALVAAVSKLFGVSVGHSKNVVCLDTLVCATVTWNGCAKFKAILLCFNSEEDIVGCLEGLSLISIKLDA